MLGSLAHVAVTDAAVVGPRPTPASAPAPAAKPDGGSAGATQATAGAVRAVAPAASPGARTARPFDLVDGRPAFDLFHAVQARRSHKHFLKRPVPRRALEVMLEAAVLAPNHKMTEPWAFVVLGERARRRYGAIRAAVKVADDAEGRAEKRARIIDEVVAIPAIIAVTMRVDDDEVRREEDYAATFMAVQNLLLAGVALGLATKLNTGRTMDHPEVRALLGVRPDERVVAFINVGVPTESRGPAARTPAAERTTWLD
jgi:nitroreductase